MKRKILKFISLSLIFAILTSNFVFADSNYVNSVGSVSSDIHNHEDEIVGIDYNQTKKSEYSDELINFEDNETKVYATKASIFSVIIPKKVILNGTETNQGEYSVKVKGDIAANDVIEVIPDYSFNFNQINKESVPASVSQDKITFKVGDGLVTEDNIIAGVTTTGSVKASDGISAGSWSGTFKFNIGFNSFSRIGVCAIDENGVNLNATSNDIVGTEKTVLLNALEETGFVEDSSEVDALIEVKSDDFDNIADTTFDVSDIAEEGDTVVILHFDEEKGEWEYIGTETVTDGKVSGDFTSYSPVAFIVVKDNHTHIYEESITKEANCTEVGELKFSCECGSFYTQDVKALGHKSVNGGISSVHTKCNVCGVTLNSTHNYTKTTQTAATCTVEGISKYTCDCGYFYTAHDIPATGHSGNTTSGGACYSPVYHTHTNACNCGGYGVLKGYHFDRTDCNWIGLYCNKCNARYEYASKNDDMSWVSDNWWKLYKMSASEAAKTKCSAKICNLNTSTIENYELTCTK